MTRCIRTREIGARMIRAAHEVGVRRLAMEALPPPADGRPGPMTAVPVMDGGYLAQPDMRRLITTALDLGWSLWAYEARIDSGFDRTQLLSAEFTNWREREQASNLCQVLAAAPGEPLLVWCGNSHASKIGTDDWLPMGYHFGAMSGVEAFVIDQAVTVDFPGALRPWLADLLVTLADTLTDHGGTVGILSDQAPPPLRGEYGVDALIVSNDNALT